MIESKDIHLSLDEARAELNKRWNNAELKSAIEKELGENFMPQFSERPRLVSFRQICTPDNGFTFLYQCAKYIGGVPLITEYHDDIFVSFNEDKKGWGRLRLTMEDGSKAMVDIMDFHANEKKKLGECVLKTGENLIDFHHKLIEISGYAPEIIDNSKWLRKFGHPADYYYPFILHLVAHGVWFENIEPYNEDGSDHPFIKNITNPTIQKIKDKFGLNPLVVRVYPLNQNAEEDFYWWSYPKNVNDWIVEYAKKDNLTFKKVDLK
jgi:hypothetical protein